MARTHVNGIDIVSDAAATQGLMSLWLNGRRVLTSPIGSPLAGVDFDQMVLHPVDYDFLQQAFGVVLGGGSCPACASAKPFEAAGNYSKAGGLKLVEVPK